MSRSKKSRASIDDLVGEVDRPDPTAESEAVSHTPAGKTAPPPPPPLSGGGKPVTVFVTEADRWRLRALATAERKPINDLLQEFINDGLRKRGEPPLTPQAANRSVPSSPRLRN